MEFKQITITNFLSYYGENTLKFSPLTTIIIGQNNTGKSKLFDAINFAIYERIYDTQSEQWIDDSQAISALILNKHKINEALKDKTEFIDVSVSLLIDDISSSDFSLNIQRCYTFKLENENYVYSTKTVTVQEIDNFDGSTSPYMGTIAEDKIARYFSKSIKNFFLFQGEAASKIMQLHRGGNFYETVQEIARLELFNEAKGYAHQYESTISNAITRKHNKNKKVTEDRERINNEIQAKQNTLRKYEDTREENRKASSEYGVKLDELRSQVSNLEEFEKYFKEKEENSKEFDKISKDLKSLENQTTTIAENTVFYKVRDKISSFKDFYSKLEKKGEVPPSIPQAEIRKALKCCRCTICNSDLSEGTEGRKFAESRLSKCDTDKLGNELRNLNWSMDEASDEVQKVPSILENIIKEKQKIEENKNGLKLRMKELDKYFSNLEFNDAETKTKKAELDKLKNDILSYAGWQRDADREVSKADGSILVLNNEILSLQAQLKDLIIDDDDVSDEDKDKLNYATKLKDIMDKLYTVANETAYFEVQEKANEFYKEMTRENAALVGDIKIDLDTSEIYTIDENGNRILNINQGNRISIQLAVIAGILTVAQEQFDVQYPFVTDAPVSHLGGDNKKSTIETMINAFEQSIIIIKDDTSTKNKSNDEIRKLINESSDIEIAYELALSKSENINDQYTVVNKIKG